MSVRYELRDHIATVTIDRPGVRNAVDAPTAQALAEAFRRFDDDEGALVAVLTGAGGYFCAGADLKAVAAGEQREIAASLEPVDADELAAEVESLRSLSPPIIPLEQPRHGL